MKKILITGASTGLGRYLHESFLGSTPLNRKKMAEHHNKHYNVIIHCAGSSDHKSQNIIKEAELLLENLLNISHNIFVFISSVDIYREPSSYYSVSKLNCEGMLKNHPQCLILRASMILGPTMRDNHITKLQKNEKLGLADVSTFNYVSMSKIKLALSMDKVLMKRGNFDFVSDNNLSIKKVKRMLHSSSAAGEYVYKSPLKFDNPIFNTFPQLGFKSEQALKELVNA
ncbi:hypothetical protein N9C75_03485 [Alphaproteobacteria bacterium]|nr:hypothetical protein [Alphaproteobacteria bacterium]